MKTRALGWCCAVIALAAAGLPASLWAQGDTGPLHFDKAYDFQFGKPIELGVKVGPVQLSKVQFANIGRGGGGVKDTIVGKLRGQEGTQTTLRATFAAENRKREKWETTVTIEFLDQDGKLIDRVTKAQSWEAESGDLEIDRPILDYVVPLIAKVHLRFDAKLD